MRYMDIESNDYMRCCKKVAERAHENTIARSQAYGANLEIGSEDWGELYSEEWLKAYHEVFEGITIVPAK